MQILRYLPGADAVFCTGGQFISEKGGTVHPHRTLDTYVLLFGNSGEYRISQNGREYRLLPDTDGLTEQLENYNSKYPLDIDIDEYADLVNSGSRTAATAITASTTPCTAPMHRITCTTSIR